MSNCLDYAIQHACSLLPMRLDKYDADDIELSLSLTLEYAALTNHANQSYQVALALFQEGLILRTLHVGKHSLDVASLHFNTGVVHDDLEQYDQAINRYHDSLRIRLDHLNRNISPKEASELDDSVLLTLKCMGHVYKVTDDVDNAICCYIKGLEILTVKSTRHRESADSWSKMGLRLDLAIPPPTIIFSEMREKEVADDSWKFHFRAINKKALCHHFSELPPGKRTSSGARRLKKEMVKLHSTIIALIQQKKHISEEDESNGTVSHRHAKPTLSSVLLASLSARAHTVGDTFDTALMSSSFQLGRIRLEQTRFDEAADHLEVALRTKWDLDPTSSSDSDSDVSFVYKSLTRRQPVSEDGPPEEGAIYYALGVAHSQLDDHERATRCFLTALRYLRRRLRLVDSLEVARVLFDTATSYYYLCDFEQAESLWKDCLRILRIHETTNGRVDDDVDNSDCKIKLRQGVVLYCLVLNQCAVSKDYDAKTFTQLNQAQTLLANCEETTLASYMEFLTGHFLLHTATLLPIRMRNQIPSNMRIVPMVSGRVKCSDWNEMCQSALTLFEQVKNECWFDTSTGIEEVNEVKNLPISAHLCLLEGQAYELKGSFSPALSAYTAAVDLYCIACGQENVYAASVLHRIGMLWLHSKGNGHKALGCFNGSLEMRKSLLGGNDRRLAETLYCSATVLTLLYRYEAAMERFHEALRVQMSTVGQNSSEVATTLTGEFILCLLSDIQRPISVLTL